MSYYSLLISIGEGVILEMRRSERIKVMLQAKLITFIFTPQLTFSPFSMEIGLIP
jgi:hypothetical protein